MNDRRFPLCVDLDGTLIHSDLLIESFLLLIKKNPLWLFVVPFWLLGGKARLKSEIAARVSLDGAALPYTRELLEHLHDQRRQGRALWLVTASDHRLAQAVADHVGLFVGVMASDGTTNLAGHRKADALAARFGARGFDYCGNASVDLAVWAQARKAVVVNADATLARAAAERCPVALHIAARPLDLRTWSKALRIHQWAKNLLVLVPVAAAHTLVQGWWPAVLAFITFSLCASSVYLLNDLLDLAADRHHHSKCHRPLASGRMSLLLGLLAAPLLLVSAVVIAALWLPTDFRLTLALYYALTLAYSLWLKRMVIVDVLMLASLYTLRLIAGAAATDVPLSFWLLMFSVFLFLSLAIVKRYAELDVTRKAGRTEARGRGYQTDDLDMLRSLGSASGYGSMLVLAMYLNSPDVARMYRHPQLVWLLVPLTLYWISRIWLQTHRGQMHDDPLVYALKDPASLAVSITAIAVLALAA